MPGAPRSVTIDRMSEGSPAPAAHARPAAPSRHERRLELFVTILLAVATVATAWSGYQSARWSGIQTINFSKANASRVEATQRSTQAGQQTVIDVTTFVAWVDAYATGHRRLRDFYFARFRPEFKPAVTAWIASRPLKNRHAAPTPFALPQYRLAAKAEADALLRTADAATAQAKVDNQRSDNYVLAVVLFAASLFFAGISTKLERLRFRTAIVVLGYALFLGTLVWVATFPVTVSV
jgi:hypothetical protein